MSTGTFAEILREKLQIHQKNSSSLGEPKETEQATAQAKISIADSLELLKLKTQTLESAPNYFISTRFKMNETPYYRVQSKSEYISSANDRAKMGQTLPKQAKATQKAKTRPKGLPHKLNDRQSKSMTYFIEEKEFLLEDFTHEELNKSYRKLALVKHPDRKTGSTQAFLDLKHHFESLCSLFK